MAVKKESLFFVLFWAANIKFLAYYSVTSWFRRDDAHYFVRESGTVTQLNVFSLKTFYTVMGFTFIPLVRKNV